MRNVEKVDSWVVYKSANGKMAGTNAICSQSEWDALQKAQPDQNTLIRKGIANEGEAEKLARGTSGDQKMRLS